MTYVLKVTSNIKDLGIGLQRKFNQSDLKVVEGNESCDLFLHIEQFNSKLHYRTAVLRFDEQNEKILALADQLKCVSCTKTNLLTGKDFYDYDLHISVGKNNCQYDVTEFATAIADFFGIKVTEPKSKKKNVSVTKELKEDK